MIALSREFELFLESKPIFDSLRKYSDDNEDLQNEGYKRFVIDCIETYPKLKKRELSIFTKYEADQSNDNRAEGEEMNHIVSYDAQFPSGRIVSVFHYYSRQDRHIIPLDPNCPYSVLVSVLVHENPCFIEMERLEDIVKRMHNNGRLGEEEFIEPEDIKIARRIAGRFV